MGNRGVLLYVDLGKLEDEPYRLSKIYDTLGQYIDDIRRQRDIRTACEDHPSVDPGKK